MKTSKRTDKILVAIAIAIIIFCFGFGIHSCSLTYTYEYSAEVVEINKTYSPLSGGRYYVAYTLLLENGIEQYFMDETVQSPPAAWYLNEGDTVTLCRTQERERNGTIRSEEVRILNG